MPKVIKIEQVASILDVSSATVRNWVKQKYLTPLKGNSKTPTFDEAEVFQLKEKINSGAIKRLNKRANKSNSKQTFIPDEYAKNQDVFELVQSLISKYESENLSIESFLFSVILNLLENKKLISFANKPTSISYKNTVLKKEIDWWIRKTKKNESLEIHTNLVELNDFPITDDFLGIIYQSIKTEGSKSKGGSYYTPRNIVDEIINDCVQNESKVVDPCCGTGNFLISAVRKTEKPDQLWGFDVDEIAVRIARINILLEFPDIDFTPHIYCRNILLEVKHNLSFGSNIQTPKFDVVITNPPWGGRFSTEHKKQLKKLYPEIKSGESFSYFVKAGLDLIKDNGVLAFILPEALLNINIHKDIREIILKETKIKKVRLLDRVFKNVFTPVFRIDFQKTKPKTSNVFSVQNGKKINKIKQSRFLQNSNFRFDLTINDLDIALIEKIYDAEHLTLKNNAEWALGIVTGNNKKYISDKETPATEPILTGKNIKKFIANQAEKHIEFVPANFQQVAPEHKYREDEKLIYKFISKELVFAYDDAQTLTLNSANCLIPKLNYPIKSILALFNSNLYQFLYQKKFGSLKILRSEIEELPLPKIKKSHHNVLENFANQFLNRNTANAQKFYLFERLNEYIYDLFKLSSQEKEHIRKSIKISMNTNSFSSSTIQQGLRYSKPPERNMVRPL